MNKSDKEDILDAISLLADQMQEFHVDLSGVKSDVSSLKSDVSSLKSDVSSLKSDVAELKTDVGVLKSKVTRIESSMVTKDYLDDKMADLHSDVVKFVKRRVSSWREV